MIGILLQKGVNGGKGESTMTNNSDENQNKFQILYHTERK